MNYALIGGWAASALLGWMLLSARQELGEEIEKCNTRVETAAREATELLQDAQVAAYEDRIAKLEQIAADETKARQIAVEAARLADLRPVRVETVIKEAAGANSCIDTAIPAAVLDSLRD